MLYRTFAGWMLSVALVAATLCAPVPARASECQGMTHYEVDAGECFDKAGDTSQAMSQMWNDSYRANQDMNHRYRASFDTGTSGSLRSTLPRIPTLAEQAALASTLRVSVKYPSDEVDRYVRSLPNVSRKLRVDTRKFLLTAISDFDEFGTQNGYGTRTIEAARTFFVRMAFIAYNGDKPRDRLSQIILEQIITVALVTHSAVPSMTEMQKRRMYDRYLIAATSLLVALAYYKHDARGLARLHAAARRSVFADTGIDPKTTRFDNIPCAAQPIAMLSCPQYLAWWRSGL